MGLQQEDARMNGKATLTRPLCLLTAVALSCLIALSASAQTNVRVRVMASNLTGSSQFYGTPEIDILKGLKADVVAIQEFQYSSTTSNGVNTPAAIREMVDKHSEPTSFYFREPLHSQRRHPERHHQPLPNLGERFVCGHASRQSRFRVGANRPTGHERSLYCQRPSADFSPPVRAPRRPAT